MALSLLPLLLCCQPESSVKYVEQRDGGLWLDGNQYYQYVFSLVDSEPAVSGCNFWAWGGEARPRHEQWQVGDPYMGDPAHKEIRGSEVEVFFRHADEGLSPWQDIRGFEVCGADGVYHEAQARLNEPNKSVIVTAEAVSHPVGVRYCYRAFLPGNLRNHRNLPVFPFVSR